MKQRPMIVVTAYAKALEKPWFVTVFPETGEPYEANVASTDDVQALAAGCGMRNGDAFAYCLNAAESILLEHEITNALIRFRDIADCLLNKLQKQWEQAVVELLQNPESVTRR